MSTSTLTDQPPAVALVARDTPWVQRLHWLSRHARSPHAVAFTLTGAPIGALVSLALHAGSDPAGLPSSATLGALAGVAATTVAAMLLLIAANAAAAARYFDRPLLRSGDVSWAWVVSTVVADTRAVQRDGAHDPDTVARWLDLRRDVWAADHPDATGRDLLLARQCELRATTHDRRGRLMFPHRAIPIRLADDRPDARHVPFSVRERARQVFAAATDQVIRDVWVTALTACTLLAAFLAATAPLVRWPSGQTAPGVAHQSVVDAVSFLRWFELVGVLGLGAIAVLVAAGYAAARRRTRPVAGVLAGLLLAQCLWVLAFWIGGAVVVHTMAS